VDELEELGIAERRANPADRRARAVHLTAKGRRLVTKVAEAGMAHDAEFTGALTRAERAELVALLSKLSAARGLVPGVHPRMAAPD
jgi:DNA-binding MarR family transcriptional regulator